MIKNIAILFLIGVVSLSCNEQNKSAGISPSESQETTVFSKGKKITNDNFTGTAWLENLVQADSVNQNSVGSVTFEPGAITGREKGETIWLETVTNKEYHSESGI